MSWLDNLEYNNFYKCENDHKFFTKLKASEEAPKEMVCDICGGKASLTHYKADYNIMIKTTYEKSGVIAERTSFSNGKVAHMSRTKKQYYNTGKNVEHYTKARNEKTRELQEKSKTQTSFAKASELK